MQTPVRARLKFRETNTLEVNSYDEFKKKIEEPGGFFWPTGTARAKRRSHRRRDEGDDSLHPVRPQEGSRQVHGDGEPSEGRVVFAKAY